MEIKDGSTINLFIHFDGYGWLLFVITGESYKKAAKHISEEMKALKDIFECAENQEELIATEFINQIMDMTIKNTNKMYEDCYIYCREVSLGQLIA
jgi:hypothetical protein